MKTGDHKSLGGIKLKQTSKAATPPRPRTTSTHPRTIAPPSPAPSVSLAQNNDALLKTCKTHMEQSIHYLLHQQDPRGFWVAELEADSTLTSEYIMLRRMLKKVNPAKERKKVSYLKAAAAQ